MELDILHRAVAPEIVEFYGAFFIESCVYYCMEFMDAGSLDRVYEGGITDEKILARITASMVKGLRFLKDELQIMHRGEPSLSQVALSETSGGREASSIREIEADSSSSFFLVADVKPTNVLVNTKGQVKLCDFGVSGQLEKSIAKTNIGCETYMAVRFSHFSLAFLASLARSFVLDR